ncbi:tetratricopeptide repeat protein [Yinghuangia aomiensis]
MGRRPDTVVLDRGRADAFARGRAKRPDDYAVLVPFRRRRGSGDDFAGGEDPGLEPGEDLDRRELAELERRYRERAGRDATAASRLGLMLLRRGDAEAETWLRRAAESGHRGAATQPRRAHAPRGPGRRGAPLAAARRRAGSRIAAFSLGALLLDGAPEDAGPHESEDVGQALYWLRNAAEAGHVRAALVLGEFHEQRGQAGAERWYRRAAEAGHPEAAYRLGRTGAGARRRTGRGGLVLAGRVVRAHPRRGAAGAVAATGAAICRRRRAGSGWPRRKAMRRPRGRSGSCARTAAT